MSKFYLVLWLKWALRVTLCSIVLACGLSFLITTYIYVNQGMQELTSEVLQALWTVFKFWFPLAWSLTLLIALFRSLKYIFNSCCGGYELKLLACGSSDVIEEIGYGNLIKVWRKWFMLIIWLIGAQMILALVFTYTFTSYNGVFEWFDIYFLFFFV
ncbi:hypothetical protein [Sulfurimonas sp.]